MNIKGIFRKREKAGGTGGEGFAGDIPAFIDRDKLVSMTAGIGAGIRNYLLFQRFSSYRGRTG